MRNPASALGHFARIGYRQLTSIPVSHELHTDADRDHPATWRGPIYEALMLWLCPGPLHRRAAQLLPALDRNYAFHRERHLPTSFFLRRLVYLPRRCVMCGCADDYACDDGCSWVNPTPREAGSVCSRCVDGILGPRHWVTASPIDPEGLLEWPVLDGLPARVDHALIEDLHLDSLPDAQAALRSWLDP